MVVAEAKAEATLVTLVVIIAVVVTVVVGSVPPMPLQIILPIFTELEEDVDAAAAVEPVPTMVTMVVFASEMVELPTTRKALLGARLTGVSRIVTEEAPAMRVVPAMTMGQEGRTTTGRL